ncbi:MAG: DUF1149 family protein [Lactobacillus sp.]|nr:DUF1149 family protein [Lactobacillus sp.]
MEFKKESDILVRSFHYDFLEEPQPKSEVNVAIRPANEVDEDGNPVETADHFYEVAVIFNVSPAPGYINLSGLVTQIYNLHDYEGDGHDISAADWKLMTRPLVEQIETITYQITQVTLDEPMNISFTPDF